MRLPSIEHCRSHRPSAPVRRRQVLDAAEACFRRHGFHATSMAEIANGAGMSVGHIYRYFGGKDDIIIAIVQADAHRMGEEFSALEADHADVKQAIRAHLDRLIRRCSDRTRAALFLEIMAEAARNPKIAVLVRAIRHKIDTRMRALMARGYPYHSPDEISRRVEVMGVFMESMAFKTVIDPEFECDEAIATMGGWVAELFEI